MYRVLCAFKAAETHSGAWFVVASDKALGLWQVVIATGMTEEQARTMALQLQVAVDAGPPEQREIDYIIDHILHGKTGPRGRNPEGPDVPDSV